jgi:hypothetical protein
VHEETLREILPKEKGSLQIARLNALVAKVLTDAIDQTDVPDTRTGAVRI